ncbi:MAG: GH116 family glycosyl-hydrolase, partial [Terriglobia bacterium]
MTTSFRRGTLARLLLAVALAAGLEFAASAASAQEIPKEVAWSRGLGQPLEHPGVTKDHNIDDGYWQGVPLGGFGSGSIGRTYRGDFARWHLKIGVNKYQSVPSDVFAAFEQEAGSTPKAVVLRAGKPGGFGPFRPLTAWNWDYPAGTGKYYALFPKAWFAYDYQPFPVQLTCEQFSPILPNNYKETSYPVGVFIWHAKNTASKQVKVSILFSWTNMVGWFAGFDGRLTPSLGSGDYNHAFHQALPGGSVMKGIVFDRIRKGAVTTGNDGQFAIAALQGNGVTVTQQTTFDPTGSGASVWK